MAPTEIESLGNAGPGRPRYWAAVKELDLGYHDMDIYRLVWFLDHGHLN